MVSTKGTKSYKLIQTGGKRKIAMIDCGSVSTYLVLFSGILRVWTHNPEVGGSSPPGPTKDFLSLK